jgi:hypothetical protein
MYANNRIVGILHDDPSKYVFREALKEFTGITVVALLLQILFWL